MVTVADRVIKATRWDWLISTTNVDFARTLHNFRLTDSIFESVRRLLSWSGQQHTNVLASLRPAYITQLLGVSRQIIRHLAVSRLMYARHYTSERMINLPGKTASTYHVMSPYTTASRNIITIHQSRLKLSPGIGLLATYCHCMPVPRCSYTAMYVQPNPNPTVDEILCKDKVLYALYNFT